MGGELPMDPRALKPLDWALLAFLACAIALAGAAWWFSG